MNDLRRLFPRPVPEHTDPQTHWERLMWEARDNFNEGDFQKGLANVTRAAYVGVVERDETVDRDVALALTRAVLGVGWTPGDAA